MIFDVLKRAKNETPMESYLRNVTAALQNLEIQLQKGKHDQEFFKDVQSAKDAYFYEWVSERVKNAPSKAWRRMRELMGALASEN